MLFISFCSQDTSTPVPTPDTSTPVPAPPVSVDFTSALLYPLQSGDQLPLGLLGDDTPSKPTH